MVAASSILQIPTRNTLSGSTPDDPSFEGDIQRIKSRNDGLHCMMSDEPR